MYVGMLNPQLLSVGPANCLLYAEWTVEHDVLGVRPLLSRQSDDAG